MGRVYWIEVLLHNLKTDQYAQVHEFDWSGFRDNPKATLSHKPTLFVSLIPYPIEASVWRADYLDLVVEFSGGSGSTSTGDHLSQGIAIKRTELPNYHLSEGDGRIYGLKSPGYFQEVKHGRIILDETDDFTLKVNVYEVPQD